MMIETKGRAMTHLPAIPAGSNTVNPFLMTDDASRIISFLVDVFGAQDVPEARTLDTDGLILHSELRIGGSVITVADRKPDWPFTPGFTQVYVDDVEATLARAVDRGARVVTTPTDFFGDTLARFADPAGNLWWVYRHVPYAAEAGAADAEEWGAAGGDEDAAQEDWSAFTSPELEYIHESLVDAMRALRDPRAREV
jgi:PhnB protein